MNRILKCVTPIATALLCTPAFAVYPDVDFTWYANVGKNPAPQETLPAPRAGLIWSPAHTERIAGRIPGHWVKDDFKEQSTLYGANWGSIQPATIRDHDGKVIAMNDPANPIEYPTT